jgi:hypothetical protein
MLGLSVNPNPLLHHLQHHTDQNCHNLCSQTQRRPALNLLTSGDARSTDEDFFFLGINTP